MRLEIFCQRVQKCRGPRFVDKPRFYIYTDAFNRIYFVVAINRNTFKIQINLSSVYSNTLYYFGEAKFCFSVSIKIKSTSPPVPA